MAPLEGVAVGGLDEPAELAICRGPDHPLQGELAGNLRSDARSRVTELRFHPDHKLNMLVEREWLLEKQIGLPFGLTWTE